MGWAQSQGSRREDWLMQVVGLSSIAAASAGDMAILYLSLEAQGIAMGALIGREGGRVEAQEGALKYYVMGGVSSGLLLYGSALRYGEGGGMELGGEGVSGVGGVLVTLGMLQKVGAAPMHVWVADVNGGATMAVVGLMGTVGKAGVLVGLVRLGPSGGVLMVSGVLSIVYGGMGAIGQTRVKRLVGYSGVGQVGYVLIGLGVGTREGMMGA